jgi:succinate-acetate transporter protein
MSDLEKTTGANPNGHHYGSQSHLYQVAPAAPPLRKIANPAPLGLFSFASTTLILSFFNVNARGVTTPNIVVGMALGVGGLCQLLAGMWEFATGNTFGATAFTSYGGFWLSFGAIYLPGSGILDAYSKAPASEEIGNAIGFYLMAWFIFTFIMFLGTFRASVSLCALFFCLTITFMLLMIGAFTANATISKAGGGVGILTAAIAFYTAAHGIINDDSSFFTLPVGDLPKRS